MFPGYEFQLPFEQVVLTTTKAKPDEKSPPFWDTGQIPFVVPQCREMKTRRNALRTSIHFGPGRSGLLMEQTTVRYVLKIQHKHLSFVEGVINAS